MKQKKSKNIDHLWAPWRMEYIRSPRENEADTCIFCCKPKEDCDRKNLILHYGKEVFVNKNLFPYNNGHLMVVPSRHLSDYRELNEAERHEISDITGICIEVLNKVMRPDGFNIGFNLGISAGAGIAEHIHQHIVPRWTGDTNFMPILGHTKVQVDGLEETWLKLKEAFKAYPEK
ncbi:MAG: HIT domain-containing protein [bacterium]|jgi:ATP adenylyltransferase|nr:HIT domain-containing protein [bacterium]